MLSRSSSYEQQQVDLASPALGALFRDPVVNVLRSKPSILGMYTSTCYCSFSNLTTIEMRTAREFHHDRYSNIATLWISLCLTMHETKAMNGSRSHSITILGTALGSAMIGTNQSNLSGENLQRFWRRQLNCHVCNNRASRDRYWCGQHQGNEASLIERFNAHDIDFRYHKIKKRCKLRSTKGVDRDHPLTVGGLLLLPRR